MKTKKYLDFETISRVLRPPRTGSTTNNIINITNASKKIKIMHTESVS